MPEEVKQRRLDEIIALQAQHSAWRNAQYIGRECEVLCEGTSKKDAGRLFGATARGSS